MLGVGLKGASAAHAQEKSPATETAGNSQALSLFVFNSYFLRMN
jgi:hypothetical protein